MIRRVTLLLKYNEISKKEFDQYTYIITRLNNHLISLIQETSQLKTNEDDHNFKYDLKNPNMELVNFGFLVEVPSQLYPGGTQIAQFKRTDRFYYFYNHIF